MRNISFAATEQQIIDQSKTVTRRLGWINLQPGTLLQPVAKSQGLKKGERVRKLGCPIRVVAVRHEPLYDIAGNPQDVVREGFPDMSAADLIRFFVEMNNCSDDTVITRIEFEYTESKKDNTNV